MTTASEASSVPVFEIDQPENYGQFILTRPLEITQNLRMLQSHRHFVSMYLDQGQHFFLSSVLAVDEEKRLVFLDMPNQQEQVERALNARQTTLSAMLESVKIQVRLGPLRLMQHDGRQALGCTLPERMLRLQRREYFRIRTPEDNPLRCRFSRQQNGHAETMDFPLHDISGGGICLIGPLVYAERFQLGELFADCRLDIPGESVLSVNLRIREISRTESLRGELQLRLGCEFINLPGSRRSLIERYVTRLERERKAQETYFA